MARIVYVDISAKIEQWNWNSAIALSNDQEITLLVSARVKHRARDWLIQTYANRRRTFYQYQLLAILVYLLVKPELPTIERIVLDRDYSGAQAIQTIKVLLINLLQRADPSIRGQFVSMQNVKGSRADTLAREVYQSPAKATRRVTLEEIQAVLEK